MKGGECRLIEIKQEIPGYNAFIGSWISWGDMHLVVDVGPSNSVHKLIQTLAGIDINRVDYVLLTHIHIDHGGGLARFLEHFPMARVVCHEKAVKHIVDPTRLWEGSKQVLGEIAQAYGPPGAVQADSCIAHTEADVKGLGILETPGHAPHHLSFTYGGNLFSGEAGGNYFSLGDTAYLRPATPPRLFLTDLLASLDKLRALEDRPICYAHFGQAASSHEMLDRFQTQVMRWKDLIETEMGAGSEGLITRCVDTLLEKDPELEGFSLMDAETQKRERFFMANSVKGYVGCLQDAP